ncbi:putative uncharacterized protein DDB_G0271982 isoform X2 [Drosophila ficusphila]|uniref:putative uncharacterized protein DDB_G0271982 isoform X2 n=1 Tax=Drosophila ficusphila TaxID=30025 RepID=UPI0007E75172|nr:putative uncharacterized protein DDB_G0271982 isoform X2 [Drosophila ficusphila]
MSRTLYASRRPTSDVFHGDPFKIQSYNFRYADKPFYPVQNYQRPTPSNPPEIARQPSFQTYYHNPRFSQDPEYLPAKRGPPREHQKCRLQQESKSTIRQPIPVAPQTRRPQVSPPVTDSPLLKPCCHSRKYQNIRRDQSTVTLSDNCSSVLRPTGGALRRVSTTTFSRSSSSELETKRSSCEININIRKGSPQSESEVDNNVSIKIEADAYLLNNTDKVKIKSRQEQGASGSSGFFGIDKRLSKFNVIETKPRTCPEWELRQKEKARELERQRERERDRQLQEDQRLERERELQEERERARQRERKREELRQLERQRDQERLLEMEVERERQRLRELEREMQRSREFQRLCLLQEQLRREEWEEMQRQADIQSRPPVVMTSHLYVRTSDDRLPGMAYCDLSSQRTRRSSSPIRDPPKRRKRRSSPINRSEGGTISATRSPTPPPISIQNGSSLAPIDSTTSYVSSPNESPHPSSSRSSTPVRYPQRSLSPTPTIPRNLDRTSSGTSNGNVHVTVTTKGIRSNCSVRHSSKSRDYYFWNRGY